LRLPTHRSLYAWELEKGNRELKVRVEGQLTFNGSAQLLNGALAGCGLAYVPEGMAEGCIAKGRLRRVLADTAAMIRPALCRIPSWRRSAQPLLNCAAS
jgi:DNA-binding transcriptional LysR family regulator